MKVKRRRAWPGKETKSERRAWPQSEGEKCITVKRERKREKEGRGLEKRNEHDRKGRGLEKKGKMIEKSVT